MKKNLPVFVFLVCAAASLSAQQYILSTSANHILPGYRGIATFNFYDAYHDFKLTVFDLIKFYPDGLPFQRNEIYAKYGRPFTNKIYRDYFNAKNWYTARPDFQNDWLTETDKANAALIRSLEQAPKFEETLARVMQNLEYSGRGAVLTAASKTEVVLSDPEIETSMYALNSGDGSNIFFWCALGDWLLVYGKESTGERVPVAAYKVDHASRRILDSVNHGVDAEILKKLLRAQNRIIPAYMERPRR